MDRHSRLINFILRTALIRGQLIIPGKTLTMRHWPPSSIKTDQLASYPKAIHRLKREGKLSATP